MTPAFPDHVLETEIIPFVLLIYCSDIFPVVSLVNYLFSYT